MTRHIVLGNGRLLVNIDRWLQVRDIYFPLVGQENHLLGRANRVGVFIDGRLSWINGGEWSRELGLKQDTLLSSCSARNDDLRVALKLNDCVHCSENVFLRKITVTNHSNVPRDLVLFFHHDLCLYGDGIGDTAGYDPVRNALFHYKKHVYVLVNAIHAANARSDREQGDVFEYAVGDKTLEDAEDGRLENVPIAQGSVSSVCSIKLRVDARASNVVYYWMCFGKDFAKVHELDDLMRGEHVERFFNESEMCWRGWIGVADKRFKHVPDDAAELYRRSLLIMRTQVNNNGAIIAANDSDNTQFNRDTYSYMWPRDGAIAAMALQKAGYVDLSEKFFRFCAGVLSSYGCFLHKYNPDGSLGSSWHPWVRGGKFSLPIQEDGTGLVVHAFEQHYAATKDKKLLRELYPKLVKPAADFMVSYRDEQTNLIAGGYDLWEERYGISAFAVSAVIAGLRSAANLGMVMKDKGAKKYARASEQIHAALYDEMFDEQNDRFLRRICTEHDGIKRDRVLDSTLFALHLFGACDVSCKRTQSTLEQVRDRLWVKGIGGLARYEGDGYYQKRDDIPGNPWFVCTLWLGKWFVMMAKDAKGLEPAREIMQWVVKHQLSTGVLGEQLDPDTGELLSVSPLTWSHAEFVDFVIGYEAKMKELVK